MSAKYEGWMFNWDDLRYFLEVVRNESLSQAADKLGVNHTTVARRIKMLEESLSACLFDKRPTGYKLTDTGAQLVKLAHVVETNCISAQEIASGADVATTGTVRLSVPEGFGSHFLVNRLPSFYELYPGVQLDIVALPNALSVSKREAHIAVTLDEPTIGRLIARPLTEYTMQLYGSDDYLAQHPPIQTIEDLKCHQLVANMVSRPDLRFIDEIIPDFETRLRLKSINAQLSAVEAGLGISLLPRYMADHRPNLAVILPDEACIRRTFWLSMHEDMRHVRRIKAVWGWLKDVVASNRQILVGNQ